jgi:hypothetical protein
MLKNDYSLEETLAAMEAHAALLDVMDGDDGSFACWFGWKDGLTDSGIRKEVLRFMPQVEAVWDLVSDTVRRVMSREVFLQRVFEKFTLPGKPELALESDPAAVAEALAEMFTRGEYPHGNGSIYPVYLTNQCGEVTEQYDDLLDDLGLEFGSFNGEFYPLTDREAVYIADDLADVAGGCGAVMGYSAVYRGKKYLLPSIEIGFDPEKFGDRSEALALAYELEDELGDRLAAIGGHVILDEDHDQQRHLLKILIPFGYAMSVADDFEGWKRHLETDLLAFGMKAEGPASKV